ncbi:hypothetical protein [Metallosphaera javensis (ex Sakai et al. 2022)]|uniref:hypothetical protein n=1 Tax=Metallosphaera javensis (ex Sakai et al. 2022) TaxID=2775498 RepID=UPI00258B5D43|nr:MAG: hypothetical protein MjAS7_2020 [Metallosphaera javensis (ex Sakai et al. 2022)]
MILATLGSDKSVSTVNAIMTEVFAGVKPEEIRIYREDSNGLGERKAKLEGALRLLGLSPQIREVVVGNDITSWRSRMREESVNVLDITPGRKYMALTAFNYVMADQVRYAYILQESEGYRVFGYLPFHHLRLTDMRTGDVVKLDPPPVTGGEPISSLTADSLTALYNVLSLKGKVGVKLPREYEDYEELCLFRSGFLRFSNEDLVTSKAREGIIVADTNVYIRMGTRLAELARVGRNLKLLPLRTVYDELASRAMNSSRDPNLFTFLLGLDAYNAIHRVPGERRGERSDVSILKEVRSIKSYVMEKVIFVTGDRELGSKAMGFGVDTVTLEGIRVGEGDRGTFLQCLGRIQARTGKARILLDGKEVVEMGQTVAEGGELRTRVRTLVGELNYAKVLEYLQDLV